MIRYRIPAAGIALATFLLAPNTGGGSSALSVIHPIVEMTQRCLIGGVPDRKWVVAARFQKFLKSPQTFSLYTLQGPAGEVVLIKGADGDCPNRWAGNSTSGLENGIAIESPSWNVIPRPPRPIELRDPVYVRIVSDILRGEGIAKSEVKITQAYAVDLDGDGNREVVIVANRFAQGLTENSGIAAQTSPGDYSLVLVRKTIGGKVQNIFLVKAVWLKGDESILPRANHLSAIADLNGDGVMELVLFSAYHEGSASDVIQIKGSKLADVLSCSCER